MAKVAGRRSTGQCRKSLPSKRLWHTSPYLLHSLMVAQSQGQPIGWPKPRRRVRTRRKCCHIHYLQHNRHVRYAGDALNHHYHYKHHNQPRKSCCGNALRQVVMPVRPAGKPLAAWHYIGRTRRQPGPVDRLANSAPRLRPGWPIGFRLPAPSARALRLRRSVKSIHSRMDNIFVIYLDYLDR